MDNLSRREFLKSSGALVISAATPAYVGEALAQAGSGKPALLPTELDSWVAVLPNGTVSAFFGKIDMGHALDVSIAQIIADELDVAVEKVDVLMGDTRTSCNQGGASGSTGIWQGARPLRNAAAEARRILLDMASQRLGMPAAQLSVSDGVVTGGNPVRGVSYADLIGGRYFNSKVEWNKVTGNAMDVKGKATPKQPSQYKVVGQSVPRRDVAGKVFGTDDWVTEVRVPGMLHARVIRPPKAGTSIVKVDESSIKAIRGARVVREKEFLAVVAPKEWDAVRAARALKVQWTEAKDVFPPMEKLYSHIRAAKVIRTQDEVKRGDSDAAFKGAAKVVQAEYEWPFHSHASMGPACAVVDVRAEGVTAWTGSQKPHFVRDGVARLLNVPVDRVHAIWVPGPGSYGRNDAGDAALDAALLSKLTGKPVRVQYMRIDGTAWDPKGPASVHRGRAALDASGRVTAYEFVSRGFSRTSIATNESDPSDSLVGQEIGIAPKPTLAFGVPSEAYGFANKRLGWEVIPPLLDRNSPLRTSHLRDPVGPEIQFASEQFIDEVAAAAGMDPVAFRLQNVTGRDAAVIRAAAEKSDWQARSGPRTPRADGIMAGRGIAYATRGGTLVSVVAQVEVNRETGRIWARKFTVAHDCGIVVNPAGLRLAIEGNVTQGLSRALFEEVRFDRNSVTSVDWQTYPILDMRDAPETIDVVLLNRPEVAPTGAGEPTIRIVAAAVANAFFDATGVRLRTAPMSPERVKAALARA
jgi:nicotinate dehydrogenase subunit B